MPVRVSVKLAFTARRLTWASGFFVTPKPAMSDLPGCHWRTYRGRGTKGSIFHLSTCGRTLVISRVLAHAFLPLYFVFLLLSKHQGGDSFVGLFGVYL